MVYGYPDPLDLGKKTHVGRDIGSYLEVNGVLLAPEVGHTIVILEQGFGNANKSPFLKRNTVVIWEYAVG